MKEIIQRTFFGLLFIVVLLAFLHNSWNGVPFFLGLLLILAIWEFSGLQSLKTTGRLLIIVPYILFYSFFSFSIGNRPPFDLDFFHAFFIFLVLFYFFCVLLFLFHRDGTIIYKSIFLILPAIALPIFLALVFNINLKSVIPGFSFLLFPLVLIWVNDTMAYVVGKLIGRTKIVPAISPNKSLEGYLGGLTFTILAGIIISRITLEGSNFFSVISFSALVSIFASLGDLFASKVKRLYEIKDFGTLIPGHGGVLDRFDSFLLTMYACLFLLVYPLTNYFF